MNPFQITHYRSYKIWLGKCVMYCLFFLLGPLATHAQNPMWQAAGAISQTPSDNCAVNAITVATNGNVYLVGQFSGTISFGSTNNTTISLTSAGREDIFVAKWDKSSLSFPWVKRIGGRGNDYVSSVVVNGPHIYVLGSFESQALTLGPLTLSNIGAGVGITGDLFVTKLEDTGNTGNFLWAKRIGGLDNEFAGTLGIRGTSLYATGGFMGFADFEGNFLSTAGGYDVFVTKLTDIGTGATIDWAARAGGAGNDHATAVAVDGTNVYVTGIFTNSADFGSDTLTSAGSRDVFVAKLTDLGSTSGFSWAQRGGGTEWDAATSIAVSGPSIYVAGSFYSTADFGNTSLVSAGATDAFVTKLTDTGTAGSFTWTQQASGAKNDVVTALGVGASGVYVTGYFSDTLALAPLNLVGSGYGNDVFVAKLLDNGPSGAFSWAQQAGGRYHDQAFALSVAGRQVYVGGQFSQMSWFGYHFLSIPAYGHGGFVAALTDGPGLSTGKQAEHQAMHLYPNPAHGHVTIQLPAKSGSTRLDWTLSTALGQTVRTGSMELPAQSQRKDLNVEGMSPGLYILQMVTDGMITTHRFAIE